MCEISPWESRNITSKKGLIEAIKPFDSVVVYLRPNVVAEREETKIVEPCWKVVRIVVECNNHAINEPDNESTTYGAADGAATNTAISNVATASYGSFHTDGADSAVDVDSVKNDVIVDGNTNKANNGNQTHVLSMFLRTGCVK